MDGWMATVEVDGRPATDEATARAAQVAMGGGDGAVEAVDADAGCWLLSIPARAERALERRGTWSAKVTLQDGRIAEISIEAP